MACLAHDLSELEKSGLPTVVLLAKTYERQFNSLAKVKGVPGLPSAIVSDTALQIMQPSEIERRVESMGIDILVEKLTSPNLEGAKGTPGEEMKSLALTLLGQDVPEVEVFEGAGGYEAWQKMDATFLERQWGDGFPLVAPTREAVSQMLTGTRRSPKEVVAVLEPGLGIATVEKIAINAVMARCKPEHMPVLITAVEAIADPLFELRHACTSTSPHQPMVLVSGPIAKRIGINSGRCCLGPGAASAANTAIGRAMRLILMNIAGNYAGISDMDTIGAPWKYSLCLAENEEESPWEPYRVEKGYDRNESTVTVFAVGDMLGHNDHGSEQPETFLRRLARSVCNVSVPSNCMYMIRPERDINDADLKPEDTYHHIFFFITPLHAHIFGQSGWSKRGMKEMLHNFARVRIGDETSRAGTNIRKYDRRENKRVLTQYQWLHDYPDMEVPAYASPDCYQFVVVGGDNIKSMIAFGLWNSITRRIEE